MQADLRCLLEHLLNEEGVLELERAGHHPRVPRATSLPRPVLLRPQCLPLLRFGADFLEGLRVAAFAGGPEERAVPEIRMVFTQRKRPEQQLVGLQGRPDAESFN